MFRGAVFSGHGVESLHRHCTITGVGNVKQVSFKPGPEDCYRRCGSDKIWQTVPYTSSGDRESLSLMWLLYGETCIIPSSIVFTYPPD